MRHTFVVPALAVVTCAAACSVVNSPDDPSSADGGNGTGASAAAGGTGGNGGTGAGTGAGPGACDDGVKNGNETDIDCAGDCPPCAFGQLCDGPADCESGFCPAADGVCCDTVCDALCESCVGSKTGAPSGECGPVLLGTDPDAECAAEAPATCGVAGTGCDGASACQRYALGTECSAQTCDINTSTATAASECDGAGTCVAGLATSCFPYACDGATMGCKTSCSTNADCTAPAICGPQGTCVQGTTFDTHNFAGLTEYPLDTDVCMCCGGTTTAQTAQAFCVLAGMTSAIGWTTGQIVGTNCYCWNCITQGTWASNCCSGQASRPMILTVTCI